MIGFAPLLPSLGRRAAQATTTIAAAGLVLAGISVPLAAQSYTYASKGFNDISQCAPSKGPAVRVAVNGLKSSDGNLFVRVYLARSSDWMKSRRYIMRIEETPKIGTTAVCVPLPAPGDYAITVVHDVNGNRKTDISNDGAGVSNNPKVTKFLGIPRPPSLDKARFTAGEGITRMTIAIQYL